MTGARKRRRKGGRRAFQYYDWSDLETLASVHTIAEIAKIKGCRTTDSVRKALIKRNLEARPGKRGRLPGSGPRHYRRRKGEYTFHDWSDLETLALTHTVSEIAEIKNCVLVVVRKALIKRNLKARPGRPGRIRSGDKPPPREETLIQMPEELRCEECGRQLNITPWNSATKIAYCKAWDCRLYRRPISHPSLCIKQAA